MGKQKSYMQIVIFFANLGINFAVVVGLCLFIGRFIGEKCGYQNEGTIVGIILGIAAAVYTVYKQLAKMNQD